MRNGVPMRPLGEVAGIISGQSPPGHTYNDVGDGLPFFQGKAEFSDVHPHPTKWCSEPIKIADAGDILISVRAPVGPTNIAAEKCCIGRGLAAIRPDPSLADRDYVRYFLRYIEPKLAQQGQGSTFDAINRKDLTSLIIPLPNVAEQRRIVNILSRAEGIVRLQHQAAEKAREIIPALFLDMFGDPATNPMEWPTKTFSSVGTLDRGKSRHRPRDAKELYGGPYPFIQTGDIANSGGRITNFTTTYSEVGLAQSKLWPKGTLCITIAANIARTAVLEFDACFPDSVVGFVPNSGVRTEYVQAWLSFLQPTLEANAPQAAQKNINLEILRKLPIPVPPLHLQQEFADRVNDIRGILAQREMSQQNGAALFAALLATAFKS